MIGDTRPKGYLRADLEEAWAVYLPPPGNSATSATRATDVDLSGEFPPKPVADVADVARAGNGSATPEPPGNTWEVAEVAEVADLRDSGDEEVF